MTKLLTRARRTARHTASHLDVIDTTALRTRILDAVEDAIDHAESLLRQAPGIDDTKDAAADAAKRVRRSRAIEATGAAVAAGAPFVTGAIRSRLNARNARKAGRLVPNVLRAHPAVFGAAVVGGALAGVAVARRMRSDSSSDKLLEESPDDQLDEGLVVGGQVARMEDEGGEPAASEGAPRRFGSVRSGNGVRSGTR